jgi:hypothetical protein
MKQTGPLPYGKVMLSLPSSGTMGSSDSLFTEAPFRPGLIGILWASPPPDKQGLPRSPCFLEYMPLHITPEGRSVACAGCASRYVPGFGRSESLSTFTCLTTLNWIRLMLRPVFCLESKILCHRASAGKPAAGQTSGRTGNSPDRYLSTCWNNITRRLVALLIFDSKKIKHQQKQVLIVLKNSLALPTATSRP